MPMCDLIDHFRIEYIRFKNNNWYYKIIHISSRLVKDMEEKMLYQSEPYGDFKETIFQSGIMVLSKAQRLVDERSKINKCE